MLYFSTIKRQMPQGLNVLGGNITPGASGFNGSLSRTDYYNKIWMVCRWI